MKIFATPNNQMHFPGSMKSLYKKAKKIRLRSKLKYSKYLLCRELRKIYRSKRAFGMMESDSLSRTFNWMESLSSVLCVFSSWKVTFSGNHSPLFWWNTLLRGGVKI